MSTAPPEPLDGAPLTLFGRFVQAASGHWRSRARPEQIPPEDFSILVLQAGRAAGKNWSASNYVNEQAASGAAMRIALIAATADDARFTMVEGVSGILAAAAASGVSLEWEPAKGQLTWPASGAIAHLYSSDSPSTLRGPEHDLAWADELAAWRQDRETWDNLLMTMRGGGADARPRVVVTTTPKPTRLMRELIASDGQRGIVVRRFTTYANKALPPAFLAQLVSRYEGTRLARQELLAELLEDTPGALWSRELIDTTRVDREPDEMQRIVIAIDPAGSTAETADETGIIIGGLGADGHLYVLADLSYRLTPNEWARKAIDAYYSRRADCIVVERNFGGDMVRSTLLGVDPGVVVKDISSSRGKVLRAEPISSAFEQHRAHLVGSWPVLEDQLCSFTRDWNRARDGSPDRVDAMVFALNELRPAEPVGYLRTEALLRRSDTGEFAAVELPTAGVAEVFALASVAESQPDALAIVYFALTTGSGKSSARSTILDWELLELAPAIFETLYTATIERLKVLRAATQARSSRAPLLIDPEGCGKVLVDEGPGRFAGVEAVDNEELLKRPLVQRAVEFGAHVTAGRVKIARLAHEKVTEFKGVRRNHLLAHLQAFGLASEQATVLPLLAAAATGALDALRTDRSMSVWRRLGAPATESPQGGIDHAALERRRVQALAREREQLRIRIEYENDIVRRGLEERSRREALELEREGVV